MTADRESTFDVAHRLVFRFAGTAFFEAYLQHPEKSDNGVERIVLAIGEPSIDDVFESRLDYNFVRSRPRK